jgi:transposase-like protein
MGSKRARRYRQHSAADKVALLRKVMLEGQAMSAVCEEHDVSPALFYTWQKLGRRRSRKTPAPSSGRWSGRWRSCASG